MAAVAGAWAQPMPASADPQDVRGEYFGKKVYVPGPLPAFGSVREQLPSPVLGERPEWIAMYWKAWELAFRNFHEPRPGSHLVSRFIDAAFNDDIFLWDTCFMSMFCNVAHPLVPGIGSLDNFYARQHQDGEISREIVRATGADYRAWINREGRPLFTRNGWVPPEGPGAPVLYRGRNPPEPPPRLTLEAMDNPLPAWAELESYRFTGDRSRIADVFEPLVHYYQSLRKYLRQGNGLYVTDWASMDNSPRNAYLVNGGTAVDTSCQMVLLARDLAAMAQILGRPGEAQAYSRDADELGHEINALMWDPRRRFYFDLTLEGRRSPVKTVAAFWSMIARVASPGQAADLVAELRNPRTFARTSGVPTLSAEEPGYDPAGGYWRGSVWTPTMMMVLRGLEEYGYLDDARSLALRNVGVMGEVYAKTGTIWENYAPDSPAAGQPAKGDFVGWSGLGPIGWLLEYAIGLKPDAPRNELTWDLWAPGPKGCARYRFGGHVTSLQCEPDPSAGRLAISITSDGPYVLHLKKGVDSSRVEVHAGTQRFTFPF
jgi:hypothetical protein